VDGIGCGDGIGNMPSFLADFGAEMIQNLIKRLRKLA
jgi:hypothetical protein